MALKEASCQRQERNMNRKHWLIPYDPPRQQLDQNNTHRRKTERERARDKELQMNPMYPSRENRRNEKLVDRTPHCFHAKFIKEKVKEEEEDEEESERKTSCSIRNKGMNVESNVDLFFFFSTSSFFDLL